MSTDTVSPVIYILPCGLLKEVVGLQNTTLTILFYKKYLLKSYICTF
jgi:hypothetical protein